MLAAIQWLWVSIAWAGPPETASLCGPGGLGSVGPLQIGMSEAEVPKLLGLSNSPFWEFDATERGLTPFFGDGKLLVLLLSGPINGLAPLNLATPAGIRIGSTREQVEAAYGACKDKVSDDKTFTAGPASDGVFFWFDDQHRVEMFMIGRMF